MQTYLHMILSIMTHGKFIFNNRVWEGVEPMITQYLSKKGGELSIDYGWLQKGEDWKNPKNCLRNMWTVPNFITKLKNSKY